MNYSPEKLIDLASDYCRSHHIQLRKKLGHGLQGIVYATSRNSAIKIHARKKPYELERDTYLRLSAHHVRKICGLITPQLKGYDDDKLILEMTLVSPPFLVDFGGAYLDALPEHASNDSAMAQLEDKKDAFGDDWDEVNRILSVLRNLYGIYLVDINRGNIRFR